MENRITVDDLGGTPMLGNLYCTSKSLNHSTCLCFCNLCRAGHWDLSPDPALYVHAVSIEPALPPSTWAAQPHADPGVCILWHSLWCGFLILRQGQTGVWRSNSYHRYHRNTQLRHIMKHTCHFSISGDDRRVTLQFPSWWPNWSTWLGEAPPLHFLKQRWSFRHFFHNSHFAMSRYPNTVTAMYLYHWLFDLYLDDWLPNIYIYII